MNSEKETYLVLRLEREKGIKLLFERYAKKLQNYAKFKWKINEDPSWDMVYGTIYKVAEVADKYSFENEQKFASFIFRIFLNKIRDHFRASKVIANGITEVEIDEARSAPASESSDQNVRPALNMLQHVLDQLEDWQRVLLLMRSQDVPYSEIAKYVDKPEDQLKVYYSRLKKQVAERMNQEMNLLNLKKQAHDKQ